MSYDLSVRPSRYSRLPLPTSELVDMVLRRHLPRGSSTEPGTFRFQDEGGTVVVSVDVHEGLVREIQASGNYSDDPPATHYAFLAAVARELRWRIYDPQGDAWYSPAQLQQAARGLTFNADTASSLLTVVGALVCLGAGLAWKLQGTPRGDVTLWITLLGLALFVAGRVWMKRLSRE